MRYFVLSVTLFLLPASLVAQAPTPRFELFAGYSWFHAGSAALTNNTLASTLGAQAGSVTLASNFNGWNAELQYNYKPWLGLVADGEGRYGSVLKGSGSVGGLPTLLGYSFFAGPVLSRHLWTNWTPYIHLLGGFDRLHINPSTPSGLKNVGLVDSVTDSQLAMALGGGIDYRPASSERIAFRVIQADYVYTNHDMNAVYGDVFGVGLFHGLDTHENNIRLSTGAVFRF